ncbi:MAG: ThuA domain-containing protein [Planctomycetota bacterium]
MALADDGTLYVGGIGERRSWSWQGTTAGLQRLEPTGDTAFEFETITATPTGLTLRYTRPVSAEQLSDLDAYQIKQWRYRPTSAYGGRKHDQEDLSPSAAEVSADSRSVTLTIPGIKAGRVIHIIHHPVSDAGETMWSPEAWYTMNQLPGQVSDPADALPPLFRVLVFSKTAGFRHASIKDGNQMLKRLAGEQAWDVVLTEDAAVFTAEDLALFDVVVFNNTTGNILNDEQQAAFEGFIRAGGGFVGVHAATDTEYDWPWFNRLVGGYFAGHPKVQPAALDILIPDHPSTAHLPERWTRTDEWYNFKAMNPDVEVLLNLDETTYDGGTMGEHHPAAWFHEFDGGRAWYTAGGHTPESFGENDFVQHILGGIRWAGGLDE